MPEKVERKYLAHYIDAASLAIAGWAAKTNYVRLGSDLEEYNEELNPEVETSRNILGENSVKINGYEVSSDVDPYYYALNSDGTEEVLGAALMKIGNERLTGTYCKTTKVDVLFKETEEGTLEVVWAYQEQVYVTPNSIGGDTTGVQIPFTITNAGTRRKGTFDFSTRQFKADSSSDSSQTSETAAG